MPHIPADLLPLVTDEDGGRELSWRALALGGLLAAILGAANAYLGLKAGMTVAATFPAAVIAMAAFRLPFMRGGLLEQNIARTTATVGEALVAAAIFTLPAFVIAKVDGAPVWARFDLLQSLLILGSGGLLGIGCIIVMRRTLTVDACLPFPESHACFELIRAGSSGHTGARAVFGALGIGMLIELCKNSAGLPIIRDVTSLVARLTNGRELAFTTPLASPAILGVGFIIGPRYATLAFAGGALAWLLIVPLIMLWHPDPLLAGPAADATDYAWRTYVRPIGVGAMLLASLHTLWGLRGSIATAFRGAWHQRTGHRIKTPTRLERDLPILWCLGCAMLLTVPLACWYWRLTQSVGATIALGVLTITLGFFLAVIGGWLCGLVGSSNQPVSGITLTAIIITAGSLLLLRATGVAGVTATLGLAVLICAAAALSGTLIQELKVGQMLGATPWKMELAQIIGVILVAFFAIYPMVLLHESTIATNITMGLPPVGIGGPSLPAPQAALMAQVTTAILGGQIHWGLLGIGMAITLCLIVLRIPGPMVVAVGMYLSFETSAAIFVGGLLHGALRWWLQRRGANTAQRTAAHNRGVLLASGLIAGEAIAGVVLAGVVMLMLRLATTDPAQWGFLGEQLSLAALLPSGFPKLAEHLGGWLSLGLFALVAGLLVGVPIKGHSSRRPKLETP